MADEEKLPVNDAQIQGKQPPTQGTTGEMSRPNNLQRIAQKKAMVKNYSRTKKLEKLAVYSSCKVHILSTYVILNYSICYIFNLRAIQKVFINPLQRATGNISHYQFQSAELVKFMILPILNVSFIDYMEDQELDNDY